jgi:hypothetical protein
MKSRSTAQKPARPALPASLLRDGWWLDCRRPGAINNPAHLPAQQCRAASAEKPGSSRKTAERS